MSDLPATVTPDGYHTCPSCGHHTSAFCGACTVIVLETDGSLGYCGCDCMEAMTGESLIDQIAQALRAARARTARRTAW